MHSGIMLIAEFHINVVDEENEVLLLLAFIRLQPLCLNKIYTSPAELQVRG